MSVNDVDRDETTLSEKSEEESKDENDFLFKVYYDEKEINKTKMLQEVDTFKEILDQKGKVKQEITTI